MTQSHRITVCFGTGLIVAALSCAGPAVAASQRTFVSTSGVDNLTCSLVAPCRTFGAAITATVLGGEVIVLTSGGYGPVTITQSVSIIASPGVYAGISVSSGFGVTVTTTPTDSVMLRGLTINNISSGVRGIFFVGAGRLHVADVSITGFSAEGLAFTPSAASDLLVERSSFSDNGDGILILSSGAAAVRAVIDGVHSHHNVNGIVARDNVTAVIRNSVLSANSLAGLAAYPQFFGSNTDVTLESTEISLNAVHGASVGDPQGTSALTINGCTIVYNGNGVFTTNAAQTRLAGTTISRNTTGIAYADGGLALSQGNNLIDGNVSNGTAPTIVGAK